MTPQYVEIPPDLMGTPDPDQQWINAQLDRIAAWRDEQGHDGAEAAALRTLVLELRGAQLAHVDCLGNVGTNGMHPREYIKQVQSKYVPIVPDDRLVQLARGYVASKSDDKTRPDMNRESHLLCFARLVVDESRARLPLWELEQKVADAMLKARVA